MEQVIDELNVDIDRRQPPGEVTIQAKQGDTASRELVITLRQSGVVWEPPGTATARLRLLKPDNTAVYNTAQITGGKVHIPLEGQMLAKDGLAKADVEISDGDALLSSFLFYIEITERAVPDGTIESDGDFTALQDAIRAVGEISTATNAANAAADRANQAADSVEGDVTQLQTDLSAAQEDIAQLLTDVSNLMLKVYPVGSIYLSVSPTNPGTLFGGTWVEWGKGRVAVGVDAGQTEFATVEKTGGEKTHKLTTAEMPSHSHQIDLVNEGTTDSSDAWQIAQTTKHTYTTYTNTKTSGGDQPHNNLQPYITCYMFKRTA